MSYYCKSDYWEDRYGGNMTEFDWYQNYEQLQPIIKKFCKKKEDEFLHVGCGTSEFSAYLYQEGFEALTCIDISFTCIEAMGKRMREKGMPSIYFR